MKAGLFALMGLRLYCQNAAEGSCTYLQFTLAVVKDLR
jgi:hypothetical protein